VPEHSGAKYRSMRVGLLGASFDTGNLGVSALAESAIKCLLHRWPDAEIVLIASIRETGEHRLRINNRDVVVKKLPIRICKNLFLSNHFLVFVFYAALLRVVPWRRLKSFVARRNCYVRDLMEIDFAADISGGDSFSDIYGRNRFLSIVVFKWLVLFFGKPLILLPQTYGPFRSRIAKSIARHILRRSQTILSRDKAGVDYLRSILDAEDFTRKVRFVPDVAFVLDPRGPEHLTIEPSPIIRRQDSIVVGLNVSGLLFNGGYTQNNMFGLKTDYRTLVHDVARMLLKDENVVVLLVPHVFPQAVYRVESDPDACLIVYEQLRQVYPNRISLVKGQYDQGEIKYIIGLCDFFIGSRMHACIAALSQCIPAIGLAYSKKFQGVFETVDAEQFVVDMCHSNSQQTLTTISDAFGKRSVISQRVASMIPIVQQQILSMFDDVPDK
jgi:colanic acid/amylovoran biosynthesis protein